MLRPFVADLHVHSVLSPCATHRMAPTWILRQAARRRIDILAITDHNSAENVAAVVEAAAGTGVMVLPGMEVETREEVHLVVLFNTVAQALAWQEFVYAHLPDLPNDERSYGSQLVVGPDDQFLRRNPRRLLVATDLSVGTVQAQVSAAGGLCIPAHVDRPSYSILSNLGFIPDDLDFPALEISRNGDMSLPEAGNWALIRSSDAHDLQDVGTCLTTFLLEEPTTRELDLACRGQLGRALLATKKRSGRAPAAR